MASREGLVRRVSQKRSFGVEDASAAAWSYCFRGADGRILLNYGVRWPPGSRLDQSGPRWQDHSLLKLAVSSDGGGDWDAWQVAILPPGLGSTYATIVEVEPNLLFCQVDGWLLHVQLDAPDGAEPRR